MLFFTHSSFAQFNHSAPCETNVFCYPDWCNQRRSVGLIYLMNNGIYESQGTGFLITNDKGDGRPYFMTAYHIIDRDKNGSLSATELALLDDIKIVFNYQFDHCNSSNTGPEPPQNEFIIGADLVSQTGDTPRIGAA